MDNLTLTLPIVVFFFTLVSVYLFYRRISEADNEYNKAKNIVSEITLNFGRKMRKQENEIKLLSERADNLPSEREKLLRKLENSRKELAKIANDPERTGQSQSKMMAEVKAIEEEIKQIAKTQKTIEQKLEKLEKIPTRVQRARPKLDHIIPITIKRDSALPPLTEYQLKILEILATEGEKTAPEMKKKIGITREHTSRLMRRLYDEGYVERNMRKMPYVYRIKEEAREIFKEE